MGDLDETVKGFWSMEEKISGRRRSTGKSQLAREELHHKGLKAWPAMEIRYPMFWKGPHLRKFFVSSHGSNHISMRIDGDFAKTPSHGDMLALEKNSLPFLKSRASD